MKKIFLKILLKLIGEDVFSIKGANTKLMQDWLYESFAKDGYKQYYTLRKKGIQNDLTIGMKQEDYWKNLGRIEELQALNTNIKKEVDRRKKIKLQHE